VETLVTIWVETWVDVVGVVGLELVTLVAADVGVVATVVELTVDVDVVVTTWVGGLGGSRWKIPANAPPPLTRSPTANPSVGEVRETECKASPKLGIPAASGGEIVVATQDAPSQ
jgi:hypothetical protein